MKYCWLVIINVQVILGMIYQVEVVWFDPGLKMCLRPKFEVKISVTKPKIARLTMSFPGLADTN